MKITKEIGMFISICVVGAFISILPFFYAIPVYIGWGFYAIEIAILICVVLSGLNAWDDFKAMFQS